MRMKLKIPCLPNIYLKLICNLVFYHKLPCATETALQFMILLCKIVCH